MNNRNIEALIEGFREFRGSDRFYILILAVFCLSVPILWLHGRIMYFWDSALPFRLFYDFKYLNYSWEQLNGLGYFVPLDKFGWILYPYLILLPITGSLWITQSLVISLFLFTASTGMYFLLQHISMLSGKNIHSAFFFTSAFLYIVNYYSYFVYNYFYPGLFAFTVLPYSVLMILLVLENMNNLRKVILFSVAYSLTIETASLSFISLSPSLLYFLIPNIAIILIFWKKIMGMFWKKSKALTIKRILVFLSVFIITNFWWIFNFLSSFASQYRQSSVSHSNVIYTDFTTLGSYPAKWLSTIAIYPQLFPTLGSNNFPWIWVFALKNIVFLVIGIIFFIVLLLPLFTLKRRRQSHVFDFYIKAGLYLFFLLIIFYALQGINPVNKYMYYFIRTHIMSLVPYLYSSRLPFTYLDIVFFSVILFFMSTYEIHAGMVLNDNRKHLDFKMRKTYSKPKVNYRKIFLVILIFLLLIVYPWYFFTPGPMQVYDTGHGNIPSTVVFPKYFYNLSEYVSSHSDGGDILILPLTHDFLSMNFSNGNIFADDNFPGYLFGAPAIDGHENYTLYYSIYNDMEIPSSNLTSLLNNINVKFILLNSIFDPYVYGYPSGINLTMIKNYLQSQNGLSSVGTFGPLILYVNNNYNGIIQTGKLSVFNASIYSRENYLPLNSYFSLINTSLNPNLPGYSNVSYTYNGSLELEFPKITSSLLHNSFYFSNGLNFKENLSNFHYLVIEAETSNGSCQNGTYFGVTTQIYLQNGTLGTYDIKPIGSSAYYQGNSTYHTYAYQLFGNILNSTSKRPSHSVCDGNGSIVRSITIGVGWHLHSIFPAYLNISKIGLAKSISPGSVLYSGKNLSVIKPDGQNFYCSNQSYPKLTYQENNPTCYIVSVRNSTGVFAIILKQNFNTLWTVKGIPVDNYTHLLADGYGNGWIINEKGSFTFKIEFLPQQTYDLVEIEAISSNLVFISFAIGIIYDEIIRRQKND